MSRQHINAYRTHLAKLHAASGSLNESVVSAAFGKLLENWGRAHDLTFVNQWEGKGPRGNNIRVDGALVPGILRIPFGYWEAKDTKDDLDKEIVRKRAAGYPVDNIIYEDTREAVLVQNNGTVDRADMLDDVALLSLLERFFAFQRPEIAEFRKAARQFKADLPAILDALRDALDMAEAKNPAYAAAARDFLDHAKSAINPMVTAADVREMLIQHILTEEIFASVFDDAQFHRENNVAKRITTLEDAFFTKDLRGATKERLRPYYNAIKSAAADTADRREKQTFVKNLYEDFYKVYNPKAADRLGVVYTPGEIVRFMIRGADWLCEKHFGKCLVDRGVEILDPATGTGTFIVELLEHFHGAGADKLRCKYEEELHANEVAILPYYVANLTIEATYAAITGHYAEFPGLVFVDTLDNTAGLGKFAGFQGDMFGSVSDENLGRIKRQNESKISVIIGNPPYNAWQENYNSRNPNRPYRRIDDRIAATYIKEGTSTNQNSVYDMYTRFFRWASDRLTDNGIIALIIGRKPITKNSYDGFRKVVQREFGEIYLIDLGGDVRDNRQLSGTKHNVFGIQTGVMIAFFVKRETHHARSKLSYFRFAEQEQASSKLSVLDSVGLDHMQLTVSNPSQSGNWIGSGEATWPSFMPLADPKAGPDERRSEVKAIFRLVSNGVQTKRDEWVWSWTASNLLQKVAHFAAIYNSSLRTSAADFSVKWDREIMKRFKRGQSLDITEKHVKLADFRPFGRKFIYFSIFLNAFHFRLGNFYRNDEFNETITFLGKSSSNKLTTLAVGGIFDTSLLKIGNGSTQGVARSRYKKSGERVDNITDWALAEFKTRYAAEAPDLTKDDIFAYVYAVLHDPVYCTTYAADLRREFPRIPLYDRVTRWTAWGRALLDLHIGYETVPPADLTRVDVLTGKPPTPKLKSQPDTGVIVLDSDTQLVGVPRAAWDYRLGNRSAIDWVLDQHKEKKIKDETIARLFDTYRFADQKERVINLLARVVTVSVATVAITEAMATEPRG